MCTMCMGGCVVILKICVLVDIDSARLAEYARIHIHEFHKIKFFLFSSN